MSYFIIPLIILAGIILGQTANYLADVLPVKRRLVSPTCSACGAEFSFTGYYLMKTCASCGKNPSIRRWALLALYPVLLVSVYVHPNPKMGFWFSALLVCYLILVGVIDIEHKLIIIHTTIAGAVIGLCIGIYMHGIMPTLLGMLCGFAVMFLLYLFGAGFMILVSKIRKQPVDEIALGFGDVSLSAVLGLVLGYPGIFLGVFLAIVLGGVFSGLYMLVTYLQKKYQPLAAIPYAPFLIISALVLLFC